MTTVLAFLSYYLPGYRAGGPIRTVANMVERLSDEFRFRIVTRDRDMAQSSPYEGIEIGRWTEIAGASVLHVAPDRASFAALAELLRTTPHDVLYLNSLFDPTFSLKPIVLRRLGRIEPHPVVLAPRGELSPSALALKAQRKRALLWVSRRVGLHRDVVWQASTAHEERDILARIGGDTTVRVARDLSRTAAEAPPRTASKRPGVLKAVYLSRVSPMKNLAGALDMLDGLSGEVHYDIYGPVDDDDYWARCQARMRRLPPNVRVRAAGVVAPERVLDVLAGYDLLLLPTLGENFGHVIQEALLVGCPVLISDRTPWRGLEALGVGWDLPLEDPERFRRTLQVCVDMDRTAHDRLSASARELARERGGDREVLEQNRELFRFALSREAAREP